MISAAVVAVASTAFAVVAATAAEASLETDTVDLYIVRTVGAPVASYTGDVAGFTATKPAAGKKLDANSPAAQAYKAHLDQGHKQVMAASKIGSDKIVRDLAVSFNGFTAKLTATEAARLAKTNGVVSVHKNEIVEADTISTPNFLGLTGPNGVWQDQFGGPARAGEGVIIADIDTGIWPENPSFAPLSEPRPDAAAIAGKWHGSCDNGTEQPVVCNNKIIGARYYNESGRATADEYLSARDFNGHGSHTASTAAGDNNVPATINGAAVGNVSGMAPAARIAVYKVLWHNFSTGSANGGTVDLVSAIDDAVADGADIINFSISGSTAYVVDDVEIAFMFAADAGVFVSASAGNEGVDANGNDVPSSVAHNSPWVTTVAAGTHDRNTTKSVTLGNGASYTGVGVGPAVSSAQLIDSVNAGLPGAPASAVELCFSDADNNHANGTIAVLDPAKVAGKIVLCRRGTNDRVDKGYAVKNAGGIGMILYNPTPNSLNADFQAVPAIHVDNVAGAAIKAYIAATASPTAAISTVGSDKVRAPQIADFSSYGPAQAGGGDLLKPDITAPGVDVVAAVSPSNPSNGGNDWFSYSGTSMAAPHIAGIAALLRAAHPDWSPMMIKSALMTTANPLDNKGLPIQRGGEDATPLKAGAGQVVPGSAFDPGLVYDSNFNDWVAYACGIGQFQLVFNPKYCTPSYFGSIDPSNLNYASIAVNDLAGAQTVTRTVTNVNPKPGVAYYYPDVVAPAGFTVKVSPSQLALRYGQSATFTVTITRTTAALGNWAFGSITWWDNRGGKGHSVRSPLAVRAVGLSAPAEVGGTGASGSANVTVTSGYTGTLTASLAGLSAATVSDFNLTPNTASFSPAVKAWIARSDFNLTGAKTARFATFDADYPAGTDVDLYVYSLTTGQLVGSSGGGTAEESVTLSNPSGSYAVFVHLYAAPVPEGATAAVHLNSFVVGAAAGNLTATPASQSVTTGQAAGVALNWSGLTPGRYLGAVVFGDGTSTVGQTLVSVTAS
jgi:subtilisin family serine protease